MHALEANSDINDQISRQIEALLFAGTEPLSTAHIKQIIGFDGDIGPILNGLKDHYHLRGFSFYL